MILFESPLWGSGGVLAGLLWKVPKIKPGGRLSRWKKE